MPEEVDPYAVSKTESSQLLKGSQSYYYWHADAERRRVTGETPVPIPVPKKLASSEAVSKQKVKTIEGFSFMDDSNMVKVYIPLEGELAGVTIDQVEAEFSERSLNVAIDLGGTLHRFYVDRLSHSVDAGRCKAMCVALDRPWALRHERSPPSLRHAHAHMHTAHAHAHAHVHMHLWLCVVPHSDRPVSVRFFRPSNSVSTKAANWSSSFTSAMSTIGGRSCEH